MDYNWLTPYNVGQTYGGGEDTPQWANDYERFFNAGNIYNEAAERGYSGAMPSGGGEGDSQVGNPQQDLFEWMRSSGNTYGLMPTTNGGQLNAWLDASGNPIEGTLQEFQGGDKNFGIASAALAAGLGGIGMSHAGLLGGVGAGSEGLMLAGEYGAPGAFGDASLLTGSSLGTVSQPLAGLGYGEGLMGVSAAGAGLTGGGSPAYLSNAAAPAAIAPAAAPAATPAAPAAGSGLLETIAKNPQLIGAVAGGLLGGTGGGSDGGAAPYTGSMPTITRGDWKPKAQAQMMQVPQFGQGLLSGPGVANSGLWRFKG